MPILLPRATLSRLRRKKSSGVPFDGCAIGAVPDDPDAMTPMRCANMLSTHHGRPHGVSFLFQASEHGVSTASSESRNVLKEKPSRSHFTHDPVQLPPQPRFLGWCGFGADPLAFTGDTEVLAGESAGDPIDSSASFPNRFCCNILDVSPSRQAGPVLLQDRIAEFVDLALTGDLDASLL
jgi:hypothetical protein